MNRLLLDTHVVVWLFQDRSRIGREATALLADAGNEVAVSYFSVMEIVFKAGAGKTHYDDVIFDDLAKVNIAILMPDRKVLESYRIYKEQNRDPFDNLLITTAILKNHTLLTADRKILATRAVGLRVLDAHV